MGKEEGTYSKSIMGKQAELLIMTDLNEVREQCSVQQGRVAHRNPSGWMTRA